MDSGRDPVAHGELADIFRGLYNGRVVALKRARLSEVEKDRFYKVS